MHPIDLIRQQLRSFGATPIARLPQHGHVTTAGLIVTRQRPPTVKGYAFYVLEDGAHRMQIVISPELWDKHREALRDARVLIVDGELTKRGQAWTLRVAWLADPR